MREPGGFHSVPPQSLPVTPDQAQLPFWIVSARFLAKGSQMGRVPGRSGSLSVLPLLFTLLVPLFSPAHTVGQEGEVALVTRLSHEFMTALSSKDTQRLNALLAPQAMLYSVRDGETGPVFGARTRESFLEGLQGGSNVFLERIWEPVVEVSGGVAMVWAPYDFHLDGAFSHCGVDVLTFLKLDGGWKVASVTYDVVREGCGVSPLGAPGG